MADQAGDAVPAADRWGIRFTPTVALGHVLQLIIMLAGLGGGALVGYQTIDAELAQHQADMKLFQQRIATDETIVQELRNDEKESAAETRSALGKLIDQVSGVQALVAAQGARDGTPHR